MDKIKDFVYEILSDFARQIDSELYLKLQTYICLLDGFTPKKIKKQLSEEIQNYNKLKKNYSRIDRDSLEKCFSTYLPKDNNKIIRIKKLLTEYTPKNQIVKLLSKQKLVAIIISKYPYPFLVGFPFEEWTPLRLKKYITLYFSPLGSERMKTLNINTLKNILRKERLHTQEKALKSSNKAQYLTGKLEYTFLELLDVTNTQFFYIYLKLLKYTPISKGTNVRKERKYNRTFFYTALHFVNNECVRCVPICYISFRAPTYYIDVDSLLTQLYEKINEFFASDPTDRMIFLINNKSPFTTYKMKSYNHLKVKDNSCLPKYQYLLFDSFSQISEVLSYVNDKSQSKAIRQLKKSFDVAVDLTQKLDDLKMDSYKYAPDLVKSMYDLLEVAD